MRKITHKKNLIRWIITAAVLVVVYYFILLPAYSGYSIIHPTKNSSYPDPSEFGLKYEEIRFESQDGISLFGYFFATGDSQGRTIVLLHGYTGNQGEMYAKGTGPFAIDAVQMLTENGYNVMTFDFRGHGRSGGDYTTIGSHEVRDALAAIGYVKTRDDVDPNRIGLMGYSMGAATAMNTAAASGDVKAVVSDSGFENLESTALRVIHLFSPAPEWLNPVSIFFADKFSPVPISEVSPIDSVSKTGTPILIIQKANDPIVPLDVARRIGDSARNATMWVPDGEGHTSAILDNREAYEQKVISFLNENL